MPTEDIQTLMRLLEHTQIQLCEYEREGVTITLGFDRSGDAACRDRHPPTALRHASDMPEPVAIKAERVGIFHDRHPLSTHPLTSAGQTVEPGQHVAFLETAEGLNAITATAAGAISAPRMATGSVVGFGTVLFTLTV